MKQALVIPLTAALLAFGMLPSPAQRALQFATPHLAQLTETGHVLANGHSVPYVIHRLPISSYPALPAEIAAQLTDRGCMIPQTYEAHQPENVIHASFQKAGSSDWAVLCAAQGSVALMVYFGSQPDQPIVLATAPETERLQPHDPSGVLGFNWGIDPASPQQVHDAQAGMDHRPPLLDHDALADSVIEHRTTYHFYAHNVWTLLDMPE
jgi:hypothetical protein